MNGPNGGGHDGTKWQDLGWNICERFPGRAVRGCAQALVAGQPQTTMSITTPLRAGARFLRYTRTVHASSVHRNLVGPPDPASNLRPVIYDDALPPPPSPGSPYSLGEFAGDTRDYQWKMQRQELDTYNQMFWTDVSEDSFVLSK